MKVSFYPSIVHPFRDQVPLWLLVIANQYTLEVVVQYRSCVQQKKNFNAKTERDINLIRNNTTWLEVQSDFGCITYFCYRSTPSLFIPLWFMTMLVCWAPLRLHQPAKTRYRP